MNVADEIKFIKTKFLKADYILCFVDSIIGNVKSTIDAEDPFITLPSLFDENKAFM